MRTCTKCGEGGSVTTHAGPAVCRGCQPRHNTTRKIASHPRQNTVTGESHGRAKLTLEQVDEVRRRLSEGERVTALGRTFGVSYSTIQQIRDGKIWGPRACADAPAQVV